MNDSTLWPSTKATSPSPLSSAITENSPAGYPDASLDGKHVAAQEKGRPPNANQKRNEPSGSKRSGFGIFGKNKEEEDERDQLKKLKAENKRLKDELRALEVKSSHLGAENERFKTARVGDRKINNQLHPDSFYASGLERLWVGITDWTVTHFRGKNTREYTVEMIEEIRNGLKKLSESNNLIPQTLHWTNVDLQAALNDSKFRIAFVQHIISLHLHEKVFSPFSYEIEDFGLGYWLKRISDEVARSGINGSIYALTNVEDDFDPYFKWDWSKALLKSVPVMFDGSVVETRVLRRIRRILRPIHPRDSPDDEIFEKLQEYIHDAIELAVAMRLEQARFVSTFPIQAASYQPSRHSTGGEEQSGAVRMCIFPGIIKQSMFLGTSTAADISIFKARVHLESVFEHLRLNVGSSGDKRGQNSDI